jgi:pseudouridine synthase
VERLQKILSRAGVASRRASERLMVQGRVSVNGMPIRELGTKADPATDDIRVDGRRVTAERPRYLLLNKPRGVVTTRSDPQRRPTIIDLIADVGEHVYPVGRLDFDSEGLLILTNDGDLAARLTHPRYGVPRVYEVRTAGVPDARDLKRLASGAIMIDGRPAEPASVRLLDRRSPPTVQVTVREGRNRQVRKMFEAVGHPVTGLRRVAIGPIRDPRLKPGCWRDLTARELQQLRRAAADGPLR